MTYRFESFARKASLRSNRIFAKTGDSESGARSDTAVVVDSLTGEKERRKQWPVERRRRLVLIMLSE